MSTTTAPILRAERNMTLDQVMAHRLNLAARHLKWTPARIAAFRAGYADGRRDQVDTARRHAHDGIEAGWLESALSPTLIDSLGYRDGVEAAEALNQNATDYSRDRDELMAQIYYWADNGDNDFDIAAATWTSDTATDISAFLKVQSREQWIKWFVDEHDNSIADGRSGYADLLLQDIIYPVVYVAYGDDRLDVWDGYHRIAACLLKGAGHIPTIQGVPAPEFGPAPHTLNY